jgi:hypothetical protein
LLRVREGNLLAGKNMQLRTSAPWTEERISRLTRLWRQGITPKTIAEEFGIPLSAVEAKADHLGLGQQPTIRVARTRPDRYNDGCCWPVEKDGEFDHFCEAKTRPGRPYCETHAHQAYVKPRRGSTSDEAIHA